MKKPVAALLLCFLMVLSLYIPSLSASSAVSDALSLGTSSEPAAGTAASSEESSTAASANESSAAASSEETSSVQSGSSDSSEMDEEDAQTVSDLTNAYDELQKKVEELEAEKEKLASEQKDVTKYLNALDDQIDATNDQLNLLNDEIDELNDKLDTLTARISEVEGDISSTLEIFKQRLRAIYMSGHATELELLLSSDNFVDFLTRAEILRRISEYDQKIVNQLIADKTELETLVVEAEDAKQTSQEKKVTVASKKQELNTQYDEQEEYLDKLKEDKAAYEAYIKQYQAEMEEAQAEIDAILAKYADDGDYVGGDFVWPLPGFTKITSPYGPRPSMGDFHTGSDIAGRNAAGDLCYGYPVVAAASGTVIAVRNLGSKSYGRYIIIDHGGGCKTLYAHLSKVEVSEGDVVTAGQEIGKAGSTGNSTGAHLHFELWLDNERVDPMDHLTIPSYN
ncbi:MAG TPA: peptidoglycan DD-metalloendopeptidase family protein [Oscillospiraceae bacterium]|nr:peptidoglycan DD-metalloendopeptidase family protein [Oscillospiraceae bacterium]HPF56972.1 peptidoglycan DD-metalloendopeptidase family protein [Clostridiales bacterium]HPK34525.1 peptidoglycan DD-metalloendopeptidase family protein [Oscillospiraceae bacterium]HPR74753.1 peptidoglycan DD-metalloendopeptidase family protein [Oscillospiraceae bacterium]